MADLSLAEMPNDNEKVKTEKAHISGPGKDGAFLATHSLAASDRHHDCKQTPPKLRSNDAKVVETDPKKGRGRNTNEQLRSELTACHEKIKDLERTLDDMQEGMAYQDEQNAELRRKVKALEEDREWQGHRGSKMEQ